jgi:hypothetical protein
MARSEWVASGIFYSGLGSVHVITFFSLLISFSSYTWHRWPHVHTYHVEFHSLFPFSHLHTSRSIKYTYELASFPLTN